MFAINTDEGPGSCNPASTLASRVAAFLGGLISGVRVHRRERRLRVCEMLALGEKRFVAVVEYGPQKFLLAGTSQNISLLRHLGAETEAASGEPRKESDPR